LLLHTARVGVTASIFVIDDDPAVRDSMALLLRVNGYATESFAAVEEFLRSPSKEKAACLILDVRMDGLTGFDLQRNLNDRDIFVPIIFVTAFSDVASARVAFKGGAIDFLEKPVPERALLEAVKVALDRYAAARADEDLLTSIAEGLSRLSARELDVLNLLIDGLQNRDIAETLGISVRTVEVYKAKVMEKMKVQRVHDLIKARSLIERVQKKSSGATATG
jgi:two-component system, LuxR family, response regulator FixJ